MRAVDLEAGPGAVIEVCRRHTREARRVVAARAFSSVHLGQHRAGHFKDLAVHIGMAVFALAGDAAEIARQFGAHGIDVAFVALGGGVRAAQGELGLRVFVDVESVRLEARALVASETISGGERPCFELPAVRIGVALTAQVGLAAGIALDEFLAFRIVALNAGLFFVGQLE